MFDHELFKLSNGFDLQLGLRVKMSENSEYHADRRGEEYFITRITFNHYDDMVISIGYEKDKTESDGWSIDDLSVIYGHERPEPTKYLIGASIEPTNTNLYKDDLNEPVVIGGLEMINGKLDITISEQLPSLESDGWSESDFTVIEPSNQPRM